MRRYRGQTLIDGARATARTGGGSPCARPPSSHPRRADASAATTTLRAPRSGRVLALAAGIACSMTPPAPAAARQVCSVDWRLEETLRVGSPAGEILQYGPSDVEIGPDGRIYVTQFQTPYITVLTPDGRPDGRIGRQGRGPGEFQFSAGALEWFGDTLTAVGGAAIHYLNPDDGTEYRRIRHRTFRPPAEAEYRVLLHAFPAADGTVIGMDRDIYTGMERGYHTYVRVRDDGQLLRVLYRESVEGRYVQTPAGVFASPFGTWPYARVDAEGRGLVIIDRGPTSDGEPTFALTRIGLDGDTLLHRLHPYDPVPISRREADGLVDEYVAFRLAYRDSFDRRTPGQIEREIRDALEAPDERTPVRAFLPGHDGTFWLLRERGPQREDRWEIYDADGTLEGRLEVTEGRSSPFPFSPRLHIIRATRGEVWAGTIDDLEVPYLHRFRVDRGCG